MYLLQRCFTLPLRIRVLKQSTSVRSPILITLSNTRTFFKDDRLLKFERVERKYKKEDKMPPTATLIYNNPSALMYTCFFHIQNFILLCYLPFMFKFFDAWMHDTIKFPIESGGMVIVQNSTEAIAGIIFVLVVLIGSSYLCRLTTLRIYFDNAEKVYKAIKIGILPYLKNVTTFKPNSVSPVMRYFNRVSTFEYRTKESRYILYEEFFKTPQCFYEMKTPEAK